ncbi:sensor histidine kinase [Paenibacillus sp. S150]|uniref:sensor histidine kinase n=1 Tax=Paenibacillus sp. S150 TaxID=2749826 RepID=UPI001C5951EE|nr:sensor histidine kinase [Paenibacillus sp. S150]MBW4079911.1 histidine kinase [Paenibacillus sp. S150]
MKPLFRRLSLKNKLFSLLLVFSLLPNLLVFLSSQYYLTGSAKKQSEDTASILLESVSAQLSKEFNDLLQSVNSLIVNYDFQQYLDTAADDYALQARQFSQFKDSINSILLEKPELAGILYTDAKGKVLYSSNKDYLKFSYPWSELANDHINKPAAPYLSPPHEASYMLNSPTEVISLVIPVRNLRSGVYDSLLHMEYQADYIRRRIGTGLAEEVELSLFDRSTGTIVTNRSLSPALEASLQSGLSAGDSEALNFMSGDRSYEAVRHPLGYGQWELVWLSSLNELSSGVQHTLRMIIIIAAVSFFAAAIIAYPIMGFVWRPMDRLKASMHQLSEGIYQPVRTLASEDEIGRVILTFNRMLIDLKKLEQEALESHLKEKERELLQLQAQINPHFLFNTLEAIDSYSDRNDGEAVSEMIQSLSCMMRYSVRNGGSAPLQEELDYIREFLNIHRYRFGTEVGMLWNIDPAAMKIRMMKLSIQPFIENALKYGWSPDIPQEDFQLEVAVTLRPPELVFTVSDTGTGMSPEIMEKLNLLASARGESSDSYFAAHTGISNVCRRFYLAYGDKVQVALKPNLPRGTTVTWTIQQ